MAARRNPPTIDPARTARLRAWVNDGHTSAEIARLEGVSRSTMTEVLQRHGLTTRKQGFTMNEVTRPSVTAEQRIRIGQMIAAGHSDDHFIAHHTGAAAEQVAAIRSQGPAKPANRTKPR